MIKKLQEKSRRHKVDSFIKLCQPQKDDLILDVGVTGHEVHSYDNMLEKLYAGKMKIMGLGIDDLTAIETKYGMKCLRYDGHKFPLAENAVEIIYSNAVIEHVGDKDKQCFFLSEMLRVTKKSIFLTTPNRWFPVELHTKLPLIHYLPKNQADRLYKILGKGWATGNYMNLLSINQIRKLLPQVASRYKFDYFIITNKILFLPVTYSILITKKN